MSLNSFTSTQSELLALLRKAREHQAEQKRRFEERQDSAHLSTTLQNTLNISNSTQSSHVTQKTQAQASQLQNNETIWQSQKYKELTPHLEYKIGTVNNGGMPSPEKICIHIRKKGDNSILGKFFVHFSVNIQKMHNRSDTNEANHYYTLREFFIKAIVKEGGQGINRFSANNDQAITHFKYFTYLLKEDIHHFMLQKIKDFLLQEHQKMQQEKE